MHQPTRPASPYRLEKSCVHFRGTSHELCSRLPSARLLPSFLIKCDIQDLFCLCEQNFPLSPSPSISLCYPWPSSCILHPLQNQTKPQVTRAQEPVWPWVLMSQIWLICYIVFFFPLTKSFVSLLLKKNQNNNKETRQNLQISLPFGTSAFLFCLLSSALAHVLPCRSA